MLLSKQLYREFSYEFPKTRKEVVHVHTSTHVHMTKHCTKVKRFMLPKDC